MVHSLITQIAFSLMFTTCLFALCKGGPAERWGASVICSTWVAEAGIALSLHKVFSPQVLELTLLAIDGALAVGLLILALRFAKMWLGVAMLLQSGELALHGAEMTDLGLSFSTYLVFNNVVSSALLALLLGATVTAWRQRVQKRRGLREAASSKPVWGDEAGLATVSLSGGDPILRS